MEKGIAVLIIVGIIECANATYAAEEPTGFGPYDFNRSVRSQFEDCSYATSKTCLEMTLAGAVKPKPVYPLPEEPPSSPSPEYFSVRNLAIGEFTFPNVSIATKGGTFYWLAAYCSSGSFHAWLSIFTERYGKPTSIEKSIWISKGGVKMPNTTAKWNWDNIHITMSERGSKIDEMTISYTSKAFRDLKEKQDKDLRSKAVKDLP